MLGEAKRKQKHKDKWRQREKMKVEQEIKGVDLRPIQEVNYGAS